MRTIIYFIIIIILSQELSGQSTQSYTEQWNNVYRSEVQGNSRSANNLVSQIYVEAKKANNSAQIIKCLINQSKFSAILEEDAQLKIVQRLKEEINTQSTPAKNMLESVLAQMLISYLNSNRYKIYQRTRTETVVDKNDFRTWDISNILKEIQQHLQNSLLDKDELQKRNLSEYKDIMTDYGGSQSHRPTLYDFLAHEALSFYRNSSQYITNPTYSFDIKDSDLFKKNETFVNTPIESKDSMSHELLALSLYQDLTRFHMTDLSPAALVMITLERLKYERQKSVLAKKNDIYFKSLLALKDKYDHHEISTEVDYEIAIYMSQLTFSNKSEDDEQNRWKNKEAVDICKAAIRSYPSSAGSEKCKSLMESITQQSIQITSEKMISRSFDSKILVNYKNIDKLYFSIYKVDEGEWRDIEDLYLDSVRISELLKLKQVMAWPVEMRNEEDYQSHSSEVFVPKMNTGEYIIVASVDSILNLNSRYGLGHIQVTDIALIENFSKGKQIYQILDRNTGMPLRGATVYISNATAKYPRNIIDLKLKADYQGMVSFYPNTSHRDVTVTVDYKNDLAFFRNKYLNDIEYEEYRVRENSNVFLFTDRSIYRPGQTVFFKGIAVAQRKNKSEILPDHLISITLRDVNYQIVERIELTSNKHGSVSGSFTLPSSGLNGQYQLIASMDTDDDLRDDGGSHAFSVEEYKRPRFKVAFDPIKETYRLRDSVEVKGLAQSFAGSQVSNATVSYKITRAIRYPRWYYYQRNYTTSPSQVILHGEVTTNEAGKFTIKFPASPDPAISSENQPIFSYQVSAEVTDINGETRIASTNVKVGYHALDIRAVLNQSLSISEPAQKIKLITNNLNGEHVSTKGTLELFKLDAPSRVFRQRPWEAPDYSIINEVDFINKFPFDAWQDEDNISNWKRGKPVAIYSIDTEREKSIELDDLTEWECGKYVVVFKAKDKFGQDVKDEQFINLYDPKAKKIADHQLFSIHTDKDTYKPNDEIELSLGTAAKDIYITLLIEKKNRRYQTQVVRLKNKIKTIKIPVREKDRGGIIIHFQYIYHNTFVNGSIGIKVPYPKHDLKIETMTFRNKLRPNDEETWSFKLTGPKNEAVTSELLASMYDASLDQFKLQNWNLDPIKYDFLYSYNQANAYHSFGLINYDFQKIDNRYRQHSYISNAYNRFNWFGFNFNSTKTSFIYRRYLRNNYFEPNMLSNYISGFILDESGEPLIGANVMIKGTQNGTITDLDGSYYIEAVLGDIIEISYTGFSTIELKIDKTHDSYDAVMSTGDLLDEVVVTGLGSALRSKSISAQVVDMESDRSSGLAGAAMGLDISNEDDHNTPERNSELLQDVGTRKNLQETAFFYPHLTTDSSGSVSFNFTTPESLTSWKLQLLGHTSDLKVGLAEETTLTQKELMLIPNPPRFLRDGDKLTIQTKIVSLVADELSGICELQLFDAITNQRVDESLGNRKIQKSFTIDSLGNTQISWDLDIPGDIQAIKYRIVAKAGEFSDGEENILPVLTNRMLVTETLPMWIRSNESKTFSLEKLKSQRSTTLKHHKLTLEVTSNPAWLAIQALPYLIEYPFECSEQTFSRLYANALGSHISKSSPRIKEVFDQWASSDQLLSNLEKNQEFKSLIIEETPWLRDAISESQQKKRVALLFDINQLAKGTNSAIQKLKNMQLREGGFPWFEGCPYPSLKVTQHILSGFGHLNHLEVDIQHKDIQRIKDRALRYTDGETIKRYQKILKEAEKRRKLAKTDSLGIIAEMTFLKNYEPGALTIDYLYLRSFYKSHHINAELKKAIDFFVVQSYKYWLKKNLCTKGMIALIAYRKGNELLANRILTSLKENAIYNEELGMYWKENRYSYNWYSAPIETHALLIEAFSEIEKDTKTIDELRIWLLKNKQTNSWKTTKQTTAAIYALLLQGTDWLSSTNLVDIQIGKKKIDPFSLEETKVEAGTGYFKTSWTGNEITPKMGTVSMTKDTEGISWGGLYWQYFEDLDKITPAETQLKLSKKLFLKSNTDEGELLTEIKKDSELNVGDLIRIRIEIKIDREMEFIHMKDMRGAGLEPVDVISKYKYQDRLGYYQSTKDAATHFFFDRITPGVYVFEYDLRVNNKGNFSNGITTIQSMYAPEFTSHSEGVRVIVN